MTQEKSFVVNIYKAKYDVYIGRAKKNEPPNKWGNPFVIGKDGSRDDVIQKHKAMLYQNKELLLQIHELKGKVLGCFCHPQACHGDTLHTLAHNPELVAILISNINNGKITDSISLPQTQFSLFD